MARRSDSERDPSLSAARYLADRAAAAEPDAAEPDAAEPDAAEIDGAEPDGSAVGAPGTGAPGTGASGTGAPGTGTSGTGAAVGRGEAERRPPTADELRMIAKTKLDLAIDRGEFDDLPLAGKPLPGLGSGTLDPNWWIKGLIERENLSGLAPPALSLRTEHQQLDDRLDALSTEEAVRADLADFNSRVIEARRQLTGGPPVVTPTRDIEAEVLRWRERRDRRRAEAASRTADEDPRGSWWARRKARRARDS